MVRRDRGDSGIVFRYGFPSTVPSSRVVGTSRTVTVRPDDRGGTVRVAVTVFRWYKRQEEIVLNPDQSSCHSQGSCLGVGRNVEVEGMGREVRV